jgi:decaprenylphospho-beta-D-ribofuranose 2-oxidase
LGFATGGWSLACDFPRRWASLEPALASLDDVVAHAGGRVYLTKDSRLPAEQVARMYPRLAQWRRDRDRLDPSGRMTSALGVRAGLVPPP